MSLFKKKDTSLESYLILKEKNSSFVIGAQVLVKLVYGLVNCFLIVLKEQQCCPMLP